MSSSLAVAVHSVPRDRFEVKGVQVGHRIREDSCFDGISIRVSAKASHECQGFCQVDGGGGGPMVATSSGRCNFRGAPVG